MQRQYCNVPVQADLFHFGQTAGFFQFPDHNLLTRQIINEIFDFRKQFFQSLQVNIFQWVQLIFRQNALQKLFLPKGLLQDSHLKAFCSLIFYFHPVMTDRTAELFIVSGQKDQANPYRLSVQGIQFVIEDFHLPEM